MSTQKAKRFMQVGSLVTFLFAALSGLLTYIHADDVKQLDRTTERSIRVDKELSTLTVCVNGVEQKVVRLERSHAETNQRVKAMEDRIGLQLDRILRAVEK